MAERIWIKAGDCLPHRKGELVLVKTSRKAVPITAIYSDDLNFVPYDLREKIQGEVKYWSPTMCESSYKEYASSLGCDECDAKYTPNDWNEGGAHDFRVSDKTIYYYDSQFGWEGVEIKYCPFCGRKL